MIEGQGFISRSGAQPQLTRDEQPCCEEVGRRRDFLSPGDAVQVFSRSVNDWVEGVVAHYIEKNRIWVEYVRNGIQYGKGMSIYSAFLAVQRDATALNEQRHEFDPGASSRSAEGSRTQAQEAETFQEAEIKRVHAEVTNDLLHKGFSVRQLLTFYKEKEITGDMTTDDVARKFVIPETAEAQNCYMDSKFMNSEVLAGPQKAKKLVSHAWKCKFMNTVINTLQDACGCGMDGLRRHGVIYRGRLDASTALQTLDSNVKLRSMRAQMNNLDFMVFTIFVVCILG
jgi:hypothetical protein